MSIHTSVCEFEGAVFTWSRCCVAVVMSPAVNIIPTSDGKSQTLSQTLLRRASVVSIKFDIRVVSKETMCVEIE